MRILKDRFCIEQCPRKEPRGLYELKKNNFVDIAVEIYDLIE